MCHPRRGPHLSHLNCGPCIESEYTTVVSVDTWMGGILVDYSTRLEWYPSLDMCPVLDSPAASVIRRVHAVYDTNRPRALGFVMRI